MISVNGPITGIRARDHETDFHILYRCWKGIVDLKGLASRPAAVGQVRQVTYEIA